MQPRSSETRTRRSKRRRKVRSGFMKRLAVFLRRQLERLLPPFRFHFPIRITVLPRSTLLPRPVLHPRPLSRRSQLSRLSRLFQQIQYFRFRRPIFVRLLRSSPLRRRIPPSLLSSPTSSRSAVSLTLHPSPHHLKAPRCPRCLPTIVRAHDTLPLSSLRPPTLPQNEGRRSRAQRKIILRSLSPKPTIDDPPSARSIIPLRFRIIEWMGLRDPIPTSSPFPLNIRKILEHFLLSLRYCSLPIRTRGLLVRRSTTLQHRCWIRTRLRF